MKAKEISLPKPTDSDIEVVKMLATGMKGNQIADKLGVNENTHAFNLAVLRGKYGCKNSMNLVVLFLRNNFIK